MTVPNKEAGLKRTAGSKLIEGAKEALSIAKGEQPASAIWHNGHRYIPVMADGAKPIAWMFQFDSYHTAVTTDAEEAAKYRDAIPLYAAPPQPGVERMREALDNALQFKKALRIAHGAHDGQTDKAGAPYILHPLRVSLMGETPDDMIVGLLHDVVEDCAEWSLDRLRQHFPSHIVDAVDALTRRDGEDYPSFIDRVKLNQIAARVKVNDIADNMDPSRLEKLDLENRLRLMDKYIAALRALSHTGKE